jgi:hypothetical protein
MAVFFVMHREVFDSGQGEEGSARGMMGAR